MFPEGTPDPEYPDNPRQNGVRKDKRNLVQEWQDKHQVTGAQGCGGHGRAGLQGVGLRAEAWLCPLQGARYVWNRTALIQASQDPGVTHLMGLFEPGNTNHEKEQDLIRDPSLVEMTEVAL